MKKIVFFLFLAITILFPTLPNNAYAATDYSGGLLDGVPMYHTQQWTGVPTDKSTTTNNVTDNDEATSTAINFSTTLKNVLWYEFEQPMNIAAYVVKSSKKIAIYFYKEDGTVVGSMASGTVFNGTKTNFATSIKDVKYVVFRADQVSGASDVSEVNVFGVKTFSGGLLDGLTLQVGPMNRPGNLTTTAATDNNLSTAASLNANGTFANHTVWYEFDTEKTIHSFVIKAEDGKTNGDVNFFAYNAAGNVVKSQTSIPYPDTRDGKLFSFPAVSGVKKVVFANAWSGGATQFQEVNVYGTEGGSDLPPAIPTGLTATPGDGQVSLSWTAVADSDNAGYNLYRGGLKINNSLIAKPTTSYTDTGLTNGTPYSYQVTSVDADGNESEKSAIVQAIPQGGETVPPSVPSGLSATPGDGKVSLSWNAVGDSDLSGYHVYMEGIRMTTTPVTETTRTITALTNGTAYNFQVSAVDTWGNESAKSSPVQATPQAAPVAPSKPTGLKANASNAKVVLNWEPVPSAAKYIVYRDEVQLTETTGTTYTDTAVTNGVRYKYEVSASNDNGESPKIQAFAKPSEVPDLLETVLPFSVRDMLQTAINFLKLFPDWVLVTLGVLLAPALIFIAMRLTANKKLQAPDQYKVGKDGKLEKVKAEKAERQGKDLVYRSTGERDKYGNRIRVTQDKYEKMMKKQNVSNELKERQKAEQKWERWKERERERVRDRHEKRGDLAGRDRYLAAYERTFKEYEAKTPRGQRKGR